tara:strand:+ start:2514 stop:2927 length:414 start_codon:yes stop_codon:yes gene_type:complete
MLINILIFLAVMAIIFTVSGNKLPLLVFASFSALFQYFAPVIQHDHFFLHAAVVNALVIALIVTFAQFNTTSLLVCLLSLICIICNIVGWFIYEIGYSAFAYDMLFTIIYGLFLALTLIELGCKCLKKYQSSWRSLP